MRAIIFHNDIHRVVFMAVIFETPDYRSSPQWQALNRIWKAVPAASREGVKEDFRIITELIKGMGTPAEKSVETKKENPAPVPAAKSAAPGERENFLKGMSPAARKLALSLLTKEGFDIYAFLENLCVTSKAKDADELWDAYVSERDIEEENEDALREMVEVCISRRG
jgi:hypothetical protein